MRGIAALSTLLTMDEYRARLDVQAVLDYYGAENSFEWTNKDGTPEVMHSCLLDRIERHHSNGDQVPSASANLEKKSYNCYSGYWAGDIFHLIMKMENKKSLDDIIPMLGQFLGDRVEEVDNFKAKLKKMFDAYRAGSLGGQIQGYGEYVLKPWAHANPHPYLATRGITDEVAQQFQIGWSESDNRITFPHFWKGRLVGWQMRALPPNPDWPVTDPPDPKYRSSPGFPKSDTLYAPPDGFLRGEEAIVVESPMSVARAASLGLQIPVVATFGAKVNTNQLAALRHFKRLYVWMDDDAAGRIAERKLVRGLYRQCVVKVVSPDEKRDLGDARDIDEVLRKLSSAEPAVFALARHRKEEKRHARGR